MENKKILIIDDEPDITEFLSYNFKKRGFEVCIAGNGIAAKNILVSFNPDIIIVDIQMPEQNGISFCREFKKNILAKDIPVVFLSASNDDYHALSAMEAGGVLYVSKPIRFEALFGLIEEEIKKAKP